MKEKKSFVALTGSALALMGAAGGWYWMKKRTGENSGSEPASRPTLENELEMRIQEMMEHDHFELVIQPVVDLENGSIIGAEILSRLNHPERGIIFPDYFLKAVDKADIFPQFDCYIFRKVCTWLAQEKASEMQFVSCNFSRKTLSEKGIANKLIQIADSFQLSRDKLGIEITEQEQASHMGQFYSNLKQLKEAGFRIYVDDFGNGVTSVKDLREFPVDVVKIDRSLLLAASVDQGKAVYRDLVALAIDIGAKVLCEGIETEEQHSFVRETGAHLGQGFLFYRPMSLEQISALLSHGDE